MQTTANNPRPLTLDWSLLADSEPRSSGWLIGDEPPGPAETQPLHVLLAVLDLNLRQTAALALRMDGHQVTEAEDPVSPQRYLYGLHQEAAVDVVICGTSVCDQGRTIRSERGLIVLGRRRHAGPMSAFVPLPGKSYFRDPLDLEQLRQFLRDQGDAS